MDQETKENFINEINMNPGKSIRGIFNRNNELIWSINNPRQFREIRTQVRFSINVAKVSTRNSVNMAAATNGKRAPTIDGDVPFEPLHARRQYYSNAPRLL
ncbi:uncharacterized protein isoform X4 [Leptinotarsa decemlineata]